MDKLKACPFCGGNAELQEIGAQQGRYCVKCQGCWAKSIFVEEHRKETAVESWNKRFCDRIYEPTPKA